MKYLVIGTGGVGGSIASFLALAGKDVTCIARGAHLHAIQEDGLQLISGLKGSQTVPLKVCTAETYTDTPDVIFLCVKGNSITAVQDLLARISRPENIIIPILNGFGIGAHIAELLPTARVADGCIYIMAHIEKPGVIHQKGSIFRMVIGGNTEKDTIYLQQIATDLSNAGIKVEVSEDIRRDTFLKWAFISAMACTGAYYDVSMGAVQQAGEIRDLFAGLSREMQAIAQALGIQTTQPIEEYNLMVIDKTHPDSTASMQKDLRAGKQSEIDTLLFEVIRLGESLNLAMPYYTRVAEKFSTLR